MVGLWINLIQWWKGCRWGQYWTEFNFLMRYCCQGCSSSSQVEGIMQDSDDLLRMANVSGWNGGVKASLVKKREVTISLKKPANFILLQQKNYLEAKKPVKTTQVRIFDRQRRFLWEKDCFSKKLSASRADSPRHKSKGQKFWTSIGYCFAINADELAGAESIASPKVLYLPLQDLFTADKCGSWIFLCSLESSVSLISRSICIWN